MDYVEILGIVPKWAPKGTMNLPEDTHLLGPEVAVLPAAIRT